jgi:hypothetical protein
LRRTGTARPCRGRGRHELEEDRDGGVSTYRDEDGHELQGRGRARARRGSWDGRDLEEDENGAGEDDRDGGG